MKEKFIKIPIVTLTAEAWYNDRIQEIDGEMTNDREKIALENSHMWYERNADIQIRDQIVKVCNIISIRPAWNKSYTILYWCGNGEDHEDIVAMPFFRLISKLEQHNYIEMIDLS